jgi:MtN3 and saliva related transmembrane protein
LNFSPELVGTVAAFITTLGWLPQILKIRRERAAGSISIGTNALLASGCSCGRFTACPSVRGR